MRRTRSVLGLAVVIAGGAMLGCGSTSSDGGGFHASGGTGASSTGGAAGASAGGTGGSNVGGAAGASTGGSGGTGGSSGGAAGSGGAGGTATGGAGGTGGSGVGGTGGSSGPHTIGGVVSGLAGPGLKLVNNGGDEIAISANGSYSFPTQISTGSGYAVTVSAQPSSPVQVCSVSNGSGTVGTLDVTNADVACALTDSDGDGVPDVADPFPNDATKPKIAKPNLVYPHTSSTLFTMDVSTKVISQIGAFNGSGYFGSMTDLAVDQYGVIYGVTFGDLWTCDSDTATCYHLATLPQSFNGLTMVPAGTIDPYADTLVGIANSGTWYKVALTGTASAQLTQIGSYGSGYSSSGDAFSIQGVGTYASVDKSGQTWDVIVEVDPKTGAVQKEIGPLNGYTAVYGLAGWQGVVFGFDETGAVLQIDTTTGATSVIAQTGDAWWGAGVSTRLKTN